MHGILTELTPEGMEWSGDDEWTSDGVHRQGHDGGFLDSE
jgi:hypothetical protein